MPYLPLTFPPGVSRRNTEAQAAGDGVAPPRYWDANLIRWYGDQLGPVGGWKARSDNTVEGSARAILAWSANSGAKHIAVGTHSGLFAETNVGTVFDITPVGFVAGNADSGSGSGFGGGAFGAGSFGTPRPDTGTTTEATVWDLDTFGQDLVGVSPADGTPWYWDLDTAGVAAAVPGAPVLCSGLVVTAQRALMVFGAAGNGRNIAWSDLEDFSDWTPTSENQAGDFDIATKGQIRKGLRLGDDILILTEVDAWRARYVGPPFIYGFEAVGHGCGVLSKGAAVAMGQQAVWWSDSGFWLYDGTSCQPIPCDLEDIIKTDVNLSQIAKISGFHNTEFGEMSWDYPSADAIENDSYITWSYRGGWWTIGRRVRLCSYEKGPFRWPMSVGTDGLVYDHERGFDYDGAEPYVETGPIKSGAGDRVLLVNGIVGDEKAVGKVTAGFFLKDFPNASEITIAPVELVAGGYTDLRFAGRQIKLRITGDNNVAWRFGAAQLDVEQGGRR